MISDLLGTDKSLEPLYWLATYLISVAICIHGGRIFWYVNRILAVISVLVIVIYIFSSLPFVNFERKSEVRWFVGGSDSFLKNLPHLVWFFIGIEFVNNGTKDCNKPLTTVPFGYVSGILTLLVTSMCIFLISISLQSWESLSNELDPLSKGFSVAFSCGPHVSLLLSLPAVFATNFGFIFAFGRILYSLGQANILPSVFGLHCISNSTPDVALMLGSLLGFTFNCLYQYASFPIPELFELCGLASAFTYCTLLGSYIIFSHQFSHLTRSFGSVFGVTGAIFGILIFCLLWISIAGFQSSFVTTYYFIGVWLVLTLYYYTVVRHHQYFCSEEQEVLFQTYVSKCKFYELVFSF